jgi:hypothetical protein
LITARKKGRLVFTCAVSPINSTPCRHVCFDQGLFVCAIPYEVRIVVFVFALLFVCVAVAMLLI